MRQHLTTGHPAHGVVTSTEWDNFFGLRLDKAAQPEMRALAEAMRQAWLESKPEALQPGEWHLPYVDGIDRHFIRHDARNKDPLDIAVKQSVARCARVSYKPFNADRPSTLEEDLALYDKLVDAQPIHASPAEHQATPDTVNREGTSHTLKDYLQDGGFDNKHLHGNFTGWIQYRKTIPGEAVAPLPGVGM